MVTKVFAVLDSKAAAFGTPFCFEREEAAIRGFGDHVNQSGTPANVHPEDYHLYQLAEFNDATGEFVPLQPKNLISAVSLFRGQVPSDVRQNGKAIEVK